MNKQSSLSIPWGIEEFKRAQAVGTAAVAGISSVLGVACVVAMFDPSTGLPLGNFQGLVQEDPSCVPEMLRDAADAIERAMNDE